VKLVISGQQFKTKRDSPIISRVKKFLDESKDGELFSTEQLSIYVPIAISNLRGHNITMGGYFHIVRQKKYWGKVATINQLKKEVQHANSK
jgi:hypothetical protein